MKWIWPLVIALALAVVGLATWIAVDAGSAADARPAAGAAEAAGLAPAVSEPASPAGEPLAFGESGERAETEVSEPEPAEGAAQGPRILGRVVDGEGRPIEGATVFAAASERGPELPLDSAAWGARDKRRRSAQSDADGRFAVERVRPGRARLAVRALDCAPYDADHLVLAPDADLELGDIALTFGVRLSGRVVDADGAGVAGAQLVAPFDPNDLSARSRVDALGLVLGETDAGGAFDLRSRPVGPWLLLVRSAEHPDLAARGETHRPGEQLGGLVLQLERGDSIEGLVLVAPSPGAPAPANLSVVARYAGSRSSGPGEAQNGWRVGYCDAAGRFRVAGCLADEPYQLQARVHRDADDEQGSWLPETVDALAGDRGVELRVGALTAFAFRVESARDGARIDELEARVRATRPDGSMRAIETRTSRLADGRVRESTSEKLGGDELVHVFVRARGFRAQESARVAAVPGGEADLGTLRLEPLGVARVRVLDADTGEPVEGARVAVELTSGDDGSRPANDASPRRDERARRLRSPSSGRDGIATLYASDGAQGLACATHDERTSSLPFELAFGAPDAPPTDVTLQRGGTLAVTVVDPTGATLAGVAVYARTQLPDGATSVQQLGSLERLKASDSTGHAVLERLSPGPYAVRLLEDRLGAARSRSERERASTTADVRAGEVVEVVLTATPHGLLHGRVRDGGVALAGALVELRAGNERDASRRGSDRPLTTTTDAQGLYAVPRLGAGRWTLTLTHPARVVAYTRSLVFEGLDTRLDIDLPRTALAGRVRSQQGAAVAGARVTLGQMVRDERARDGRSFSAFGNGAPATTTGADGSYELHGVPAGVDLAVQVEHEEYQTQRSEPVRLAEDEMRADVDVALKRAGAIEVEFEGPGGRSPRCRVTATRVSDERGKPAGRPQRGAMLDGRGRARITGLSGGKWRVVVERWYETLQARPTRDVEVQVGETSRVRFDVP